jgi:hypothetical protein
MNKKTDKDRKETLVNFRVTDAEKKLLENLMEGTGLSASEILRMQIFTRKDIIEAMYKKQKRET